jgi:DNA repair protein RadA/Sms
VTGLERRLAEARRLGFTRAVVPAGAVDRTSVPDGLHLLEAGHLAQAVELARGPSLRTSSRPLA